MLQIVAMLGAAPPLTEAELGSGAELTAAFPAAVATITAPSGANMEQYTSVLPSDATGEADFRSISAKAFRTTRG